jgi:hypothetical protein
MKKLEDIIKSNKEFFDSEEPLAGHMERFSGKLGMTYHAKPVRRSIVPYLLKAAVVTLLVTLSSLWTWDHFFHPERDRMTLGDVSPQYREVENFYAFQVNLMENELKVIDLEKNTAQKQMLLNEMKSMDSIYVNLQKELKANPGDERIINAMIEHYQTKVEIMSYILSQLKAIRNENQNNSENENTYL